MLAFSLEPGKINLYVFHWPRGTVWMVPSYILLCSVCQKKATELELIRSLTSYYFRNFLLKKPLMFVGWVSACHHPALRQRDLLPLPHYGQRGRHSTLCQVQKISQAFYHFGKPDTNRSEKPDPDPHESRKLDANHIKAKVPVRLVVVDSHNFDKEPNPAPHQNERQGKIR